MRIALICNDTRGGIQPYVALALGLRTAGHDVRAVVPAGMAAMFSRYGLLVATLAGEIQVAIAASDGVAEQGTIAAMRLTARELPQRLSAWTRTALAACEGADVLCGGVGGMIVALSVAEKLRIPFVELHLQPVGAPTSAYPGVLLASSPMWLGGGGRLLSHLLCDLAVWMPFKPAMSAVRRDVLGLRGAARPSQTRTTIYGFSRHVVPAPARASPPRIVSGYWFVPPDPAWSPPEGLDAFLAPPGPVVSVGFGSMSSADSEATARLVIDAVRMAGMRAVLLSGWGGLRIPEGTADIYAAEAIPHDWLFPRMAATVHHGGAGTTGAALRAGKPTIVVPFAMDQPFWGGRVRALGVGPQPIPRKRLTAPILASALTATLTDRNMQVRAANLGERISAEDGVKSTVEYFNRMQLPV